MLKKISALAILTAIVLIDPLQAIAQQTQPPAAPPQGYYWHGPWHMWNEGYGWQFWWVGPVMMTLFLLFIFVALFFLGRRACAHGGPHWGATDATWRDPSHSALQILSERFAKGEIQKEEYAEKKAVILSRAQR